METLLTELRACAESTRLRILALTARGSFCVMEFTEILGQSQPRLSRHLRLLCEAGLLERLREGANVWFALPPSDSQAGGLVRAVLERLPEDDDTLAADHRQAARVLAERARIASESFRRTGADWDEMRALDLPAQAVEAAVLAALPRTGPQQSIGRLLDIGTGTGRLIELLSPVVVAATGIDASRAMLALARSRLSKPGMTHCSVRLADMYRLPMADATFDVVVLQMVLHYAEDPEGAIAEAARVLRPGGTLLVIDLALHAVTPASSRLAHRWPGFADARIFTMFDSAGLTAGDVTAVPGAGALEVRLWSALRTPALAAATAVLEATS
jgi:ubiquinone/menaquinone biosynthesis C-methylase UbiE